MGRYDPTETTVSELQAAGIEPTEVKVTGKGHFKIYFNLCGKSRFIVCANSPSDWRTERNCGVLCDELLSERGNPLVGGCDLIAQITVRRNKTKQWFRKQILPKKRCRCGESNPACLESGKFLSPMNWM